MNDDTKPGEIIPITADEREDEALAAELASRYSLSFDDPESILKRWRRMGRAIINRKIATP